MEDTSMMDYETARRLVERGWATIPTNSNSEKRPLGRFSTAKSWRDFSGRLPTDEELHEFFDAPRRGGVVLHRGQLVVDYDTKDTPPDPSLAPLEETVHGYHQFWRCAPDAKIAHDRDAKIDYLTSGSFVRLTNPRGLLDWRGELPELGGESGMGLGGESGKPGISGLSGESGQPGSIWSTLEAAGWKAGQERNGWIEIRNGTKTAAISANGENIKVFSTSIWEAPSAISTVPPSPMAVQSAATFCAANPTLNEPLWNDHVRIGELFILVGSSKVGKSLLASQLALSVAAGVPLLGRECRKGRALIVDLELPPAVLAYRLAAQAKAMGLDLAGIGDGLLVSSQRCHGGGLDSLAATLEVGGLSLVVCDGLYKWLDAEGVDENANAQVAGFMGRLAAMCERYGTALCLTHHRRKQSSKDSSATWNADEAVGAGAFGRSVDSLHCIASGKTPGTLEIRSSLRSFPSRAPIVARRSGPLWIAV